MLPILRIIPVGGVLLAIMILVLALSPPGGLHPASTAATLAARGALEQLGAHPEWRQFLILAAIRRADELNRLRGLPDMPVRSTRTHDAGKFAGLPAERSDADPDDETGSIKDTPSATIPIEIGEPSSTELPMTAPPESPPVITAPERAKVPNEIRKRGAHRARRAKALAKTSAPAPVDPFEALFAGSKAKPKPGASAQAN